MKKILIIYNPRSSQHAAIEQEVLAPARQLNGWMVGKHAIKPTNYNDNVEQVARLVSDGDLIIVAGGDGTVSIAINGVLQSSRDVARRICQWPALAICPMLFYSWFAGTINYCDGKRKSAQKTQGWSYWYVIILDCCG